MDYTMKRILFILFIELTTLCFISCDEETLIYSGPEYIMFSDTLTVYPVQQDGDYFSIPIVSTVIRDYDRTISVEVIDKSSNVIEGVHFTLKSNTITIKAGEMTGAVLVNGDYEQIEQLDSLSFTMQLITPKNVKWKLYGEHEKIKVALKKVCPLSLDNFSGYCIINSSFTYNFLGFTEKLIKTEKHPTLPNTTILKDFIRKGYDIQITFDSENILEPRVTLDNGQIAANEVTTIFGGLPGVGDDKLRVGKGNSGVSTYQACDNTAVIYLEYYINHMNGKKMVTAGEHSHSLKWISDAEAELYIRDGGLQ